MKGAKDAEFRGVLFTTEEQRMHKLRLATDAQMDFFKGFVLQDLSILALGNLTIMHFKLCTSSVHLWLKIKRSAKLSAAHL